MSVSRYLVKGERVVLEIRRHLLVLAAPFFTAVGVVFGSLLLGFVFSPSDGSNLIDDLLGLTAAFFIFRFGWRFWEWRAANIVVTDRRIMEVSGLITRKVASMPLEKLTDLVYKRSLLGRVFGYGGIAVESAGQEQGLTNIDFIPNPDDFYRAVTSLVTGLIPKPDPETVHEASWDDEDTGPLPRVIV